MSKLDGFYKELGALINSARSIEDDNTKKKELLMLVAISPDTAPKVTPLLMKISKELSIDSSFLIEWYQGCSKKQNPIDCLKQKVQEYKAKQSKRPKKTK